MNLPPWQADSQFPTAPPPETAFTQRLSDDDDTAPLPVLPRPSSSAAASDFGAASTHLSGSADPAAASLSFTPGGQWWNELAQLQSVRHRRPPRASLARCAVIFAVTAAVVSWVLLRPSTPSAPAAGSAAPTTTPLATSPDADAQRRLTGLLPAGYSPSSCESSPAPKDAVAEVVCARNADPGGPAAASYTLVPEHSAVNTILDEHLRGSTVVTCPGTSSPPVHGASRPPRSRSAAHWSAATATAWPRLPGPLRPNCSSAPYGPIGEAQLSTSSTGGGPATHDTPASLMRVEANVRDDAALIADFVDSVREL